MRKYNDCCKGKNAQKLFLSSLFCLVMLLPLANKSYCQSVPSSTIVKKEYLDWEMLKRNNNFGYTNEEIKKYFDYPQVFEYNYDGYAKELVKAPPAVGIHPRILFNAEDLPALRNKIAQTKPGKICMDGIRKALEDLILSPKAKYKDVYEDAAKGIENPAITNVEVACAIIYESYRCLIDNDNEGGKKCAAAMATLAKIDNAALDKYIEGWKKKHGDSGGYYDYQEVKSLTHSGLLGLGYDFAYNWMTTEQRDIVRGTIAKTTSNFSFLDCEALPAFPANTSNWIPMHQVFIFLCCAIEGEPGSDLNAYKRAVAGYKRYLSVGFFPAGDMFESMGKNFLCAEDLLPICSRGDDLLALTQIRQQVAHYYLHAMDPWGKFFTFFDSLGGRGNTTPMIDVMVIKRMFPNDPTIDFVYRNWVGDDYAFLKKQVHFGHPLLLDNGLMNSILCVPYDESKSYTQAHDMATAGKPLTFFSNNTGNMITRTSWDKDCLQLHSLTRNVAGGHVYADRSHFNIHALGRYWVIYKPLRQVEEHYLPKHRSVDLIDGKGPGFAPGKTVDMQDNADATFIAGDYKTSYDWTTGGNNRFPKGGVQVLFTANDFPLHKSSLPWMDMPYSDLPYWQTSKKGSEWWLPNNPVQKAFRSTGLVRGKYPYVLITDDIQKDGSPHDYQFGMSLEDDLLQQGTTVDKKDKNFKNDIILGANGDNRQMLVRVLNADGADASAPAIVENYLLPNPPMKDISMNHMVINCKTVSPDYKVLLFPYEKGQKMPVTSWDASHTVLKVEWPGQIDMITYAKAADGRTRITIKRDGKEIMVLK
ncbi:hypothetical protein [Parasediminibacterium sp. JCM 36343]|uniref:hypothetical protein n=1 Tax=Parasediminibacterium sp. JCM 36343 TaxID=3374279 RepID=UPI00397E605C